MERSHPLIELTKAGFGDERQPTRPLRRAAPSASFLLPSRRRVSLAGRSTLSDFLRPGIRRRTSRRRFSPTCREHLRLHLDGELALMRPVGAFVPRLNGRSLGPPHSSDSRCSFLFRGNGSASLASRPLSKCSWRCAFFMVVGMWWKAWGLGARHLLWSRCPLSGAVCSPAISFRRAVCTGQSAGGGRVLDGLSSVGLASHAFFLGGHPGANHGWLSC